MAPLEAKVDIFVVFELLLLDLFLITSVLRLKGLVVPCNFKNKPHALQRVLPRGSFLQRGVFWVPQLKQTVAFEFEAFEVAPDVGVDADEPESFKGDRWSGWFDVSFFKLEVRLDLCCSCCC